MRRAYRVDLILAYAEHDPALGSGHFAGRVDHRGVAAILDDRPELGIGAERQVHRFRIGREAVAAILIHVGQSP
jgi:hypothetical protein